MDIQEGTVVGICGKMEDHVRKIDQAQRVGTVWFIYQNQIAVILVGGAIWYGPKHGVYILG